MKRLRAAVIGCGAIAREHLAALGDLRDEIDVLAVCDLSAARAEATAERFKIANWFTDFEKMLDQFRPDVVHVATPPTSHFAIVKSCLNRRLNVLCEKPITIQYAQFEVLKRLAEEHNCVLLENQNLRFHSSVEHICQMLAAGQFGELVDVQVFFALNLIGPNSPYTDRNFPHFGMTLNGGVIGDFLPHIAYLTYQLVGPIADLRTIWHKRAKDTLLPWDEFRGLVKGERAAAYVGFSGTSKVNGYWIRIKGTEMHAEANLLEPPRLTFRQYHEGEPALASLFDGVRETRATLKGTVAAFWRKLAGTSSYDGLPEMIKRTYSSIAENKPPPISLAEIDAVAKLVDNFTKQTLQL